MENKAQFFSVWRQLPLRLTAQQTAWVLNCSDAIITELVAAGLLKPLGGPKHNCVKYFSRDEVLALAGDRTKLSRITDRGYEKWRVKNGTEG
jgi:hypothetical protein